MGIQWDDSPSSGKIRWDDEQPSSLGEKAMGVADASAAILSEIGGTVAGGIMGLGSLMAGQGVDTAASVVKNAQEGLSYKPRTTKSKEYHAVVGEELQNLAEKMSDAYAGQESWMAGEKFKKNRPEQGVWLKEEARQRFIGDVLGNMFIPGEVLGAGIGKGRKGKPALTAAELKILQDMQNPPATPFPTLTEQAPVGAGEFTVPQGPAFPQLNERVPVLPETPITESTAFPILDGVEPSVRPIDGITVERGVQPAPDAPKGLELVPSDPFKPFKAEEAPPVKLPETTLLDALLEKSSPSVAKTPETPFPTIDFPLRQEVLESPAIKKAIEDFRREADANRADPKALADTEARFLEGMKLLGIESPQDAFGRALYDKGRTSLPIEKTKTLAEQTKALEMDPWSDFARTNKFPDEPLGQRNAKGRYVPKSQRGAVDFSIFTKSKAIPLEDKIRMATRLHERYSMELENAKGGLKDAISRGDLKDQLEWRKEVNSIKQALEHNGRDLGNLTSIANKDKAGIVPLGQTLRGSKERGGAKMDENFVKFRNKLPANMQKDARRLYRAFQDMKAGKEIEITPGLAQQKAIARIPGIEGVLEEIAPVAERSVEEMLPIIKESPDTSMSAIGKLLRSGADLTGFETKNPFIRYVGDLVNNAVRRGEALRKQHILDDKGGVLPLFNALSPKEQMAVHQAMKAVEGKTDLPDLSLFNDKQKAFIEAYRKADYQALLSINEGRAAHNLKPLAKRVGHMAARWHGDFMVPVFDKDGNMVTAITARTRWGANKAKAWMEENHPTYKVGEVSARSLGKRSADAEAGFTEVMRLLESDDPSISAIQDAYQQFLETEAYNYRNVKKHFQQKRDVPMQGFEGGKEWLSPEKNAREAIQSSIQYMEQAYRWAEIQKAGSKVSKLLSDEELQGRNDRSYVEAYWKRASGQGTAFDHAMNQVINGIGDVTWVGGGNLRQAGRVIKGALTLKFLGFTNLAYGASQVWQPLQMMPHWMTYLKDKGAKADISISAAKATWDVHAPKAEMSDFGREAFEWADKNGIADSHIIEEVRDASVTGKFWDIADHAIRWAPSKLETYSRYTAFMNYAHFLKDSGIPTKQALESAAKITDMSMTNYHLHERPLLYRNLGFVGDMASALTTFKHNQYHQLKSFGTKGRRTNLMPMIAAQLFAGGLLGFYGRDEVDSVIKTLNDVGSTFGLWDKHIPTTKEFLLKESPDWLSFGGVSKATGLDLSSKFSSADILPNSAAEMFFPFLGETKRMAESFVDLASRRSGESLKKFAHVNAPTSLKFLMENENEKGVTIDPQTDTGMYKRDAGDKIARGLGGYSIAESKERMATQELKNQSRWQQNLATHLLQTAKDSDGEDLKDAAVRYVKMGGDVQTLINTLTAHKRDQVLTAFQREAGTKANTNLQRQRLMRALEYGR